MSPTSKFLRVLVVDDSAVSRRLTHLALLDGPYDVYMSEDAQQALQQFASVRPDIVITDWLMPGPSGLDLCRTIRNDLRCYDTYLILLTSNSSATHLAEGLAAGADSYLLKPLCVEDLLAQLVKAQDILITRRQAKNLPEIHVPPMPKLGVGGWRPPGR